MYACIHIPNAAPNATVELLAVAKTFSPLVEVEGPGTVVLPVAALRRMIGTASDIAGEIARRAHERGLDGRIGIASNPDTAILAARNIPGVTVIPQGRESEYVGAFRLETLPLAAETFEVLDRWGIRTLEDFGALPADGIAERLGACGSYLQKLARGTADRPLRPFVEPADFEQRFEFDHELELLEPLLFIVSRLLNELAEKLTAHGFATTDVRLALGLAGGGTFERTIRLPFPTRDARSMLKLIQLDLEAHPPGAGIVAVGVAVIPVEPRTVQAGMFVPPMPQPEKLELTLAKIRAMVGERSVGSPELLDTHRPGAWRLVGEWRPAAMEPGRTAMTQGRLAFRSFTPVLRARVELREGMPRRLDAERGIYGNVTNVAGPWRTSGDWWRPDLWDRDEWDMALNNGAVYRVYLEKRDERWFVQGAYD